MNKNDNLVAADFLDEANMPEQADILRSPAMEWIGQRIAVYGPRFIWRGVLAQITTDELVMTDVYEIRSVGSHSTEDCDDEFMAERHVFRIAAICNYGPVKWA